jgi:hypothetical protein
MPRPEEEVFQERRAVDVSLVTEASRVRKLQ